jgi:hypothetical protein
MEKRWYYDFCAAICLKNLIIARALLHDLIPITNFAFIEINYQKSKGEAVILHLSFFIKKNNIRILTRATLHDKYVSQTG